MEDPLRSLFMPLTLAVGFAMISSYLLSSTFVPIMSVYLLKHKRDHGKQEDDKPGLFERITSVYRTAVDWFVKLRWLVAVPDLSRSRVAWSWGCWGWRSAPNCSRRSIRGNSCCGSGRRPESSYELTREMGVKCLQEIEHEAGNENIEITMGFVGQVAPNFGIDNMVLFMRGPDDGWLRVKLSNEDSGIKLDEFRERLRKVLPERVVPWLAAPVWSRGRAGGLARSRSQGTSGASAPSVSSRATSSAR